MKPIAPEDRKVVNIHEAAFTEWASEENPGTAYLQLNDRNPPGVGFHIYRMGPGTRSDAHEHVGVEEFLVLEGELTDNDGTVYRQGEFVHLAPGTHHWSHTEKGCLLAVYIEKAERNLAPGEIG